VTERSDGGELVSVDDWEKEVATEGVGVQGRTIVEYGDVVFAKGR
jgi:hypothetical protein